MTAIPYSNPSRRMWFALAVALILMSDLAVMRLPAVAIEDPRLLAFALLTDLALTLPLLYYFLLARPNGRKWTSALPLAGVGMLAAWLLTPASARSMLWAAEAVFVLLELTIIGLELRLLVKLVRTFRAEKRLGAYGDDAIRTAVPKTLGTGTMAGLLKGDLLMHYYAWFSWRRKATPADPTAFAYGDGRVLAVGVLLAILLPETVAVHLLLELWTPIAAWITTVLQLWLLLLVVANARAAGLGRIRVLEDRLVVRYGLMLEAELPYSSIAACRHAMELQPPPEERRTSAVAVTSLRAPNLCIELNDPHTVEGLLGIKRQVSRLYLAVDDPAGLAAALREKLDR